MLQQIIFFISVKLAKQLQKKNTSIVGTESNRKEIPKEIKTKKDLLYSTKLLKSKSMTLTVYQGKPNKNFLILSTVHKSISVSDGKKRSQIQFNIITTPSLVLMFLIKWQSYTQQKYHLVDGHYNNFVI